MGEVWKDIEDYEDIYMISNRGSIKYLKHDRKYKNGKFKVIEDSFLKVATKVNYPSVGLRKEGITKIKTMHRLMAIHFVHNDDPENKVEVNHIDGNIYNYQISNLEWCTRSYNLRDAINRKQKGEKVKTRSKLIDLPDNVIKILGDEAKENSRSVKAQIEYILIQESNTIAIANYQLAKMNLDKKS